MTFVAQPPSPVSAGQVLTLTARVANTAPAGGAAANGVTVAPTFTTVTGDAAATCGAAAPGATAIAAGTAQDYAFDCTVSGAGTLTFTASASGTAAGTGAPLAAAATTSPATTVLAAAGIAVTFVAQPPSPVSAGQVLTLTARVANTAPAGGAVANGVTVAPTFTTVSGTAAAVCLAATPGATAIPAGATQAYAFDCTVSGSGTLTFTASASGTAAISGVPLAAAATTAPATTVQAAAVVTADVLSTTPGPVPVDTTFSITLLLSKTGEAPATVNAVSLTGPGIRCSAPVLPITDIPGSLAVTWTACDAFPNARVVPIQATATWVDQNDPGNPRTTDPATGTVDVQ